VAQEARIVEGGIYDYFKISVYRSRAYESFVAYLNHFLKPLTLTLKS
jgi:hypothetical protein